MLKNHVAVIAALCCACAPAWAGQAAERPYAAAQYVFEVGDSARDADNGHGFQLTVGLPLQRFENVSAELSLSFVERQRDIDGGHDYTNGLSLDLLRRFGTFGWTNADGEAVFPQLRPYVLGGLVLVQEDARGSKHYHPGLNAGVGSLVDLGFYGLSLRTEARILAQSNSKTVPTHDSLFDYRFSIGLQAAIPTLWSSRSQPVEDKPLPPPAPSCELAVVDPVTGRSDCDVDSDRDGVADRFDECPGTLPGAVVDARGCPVELAAQVIRGVNFEVASAVLLPESRLVLDGTAQAIRGMSDPNLLVEIGGHTDDTGSAAFNLMLSQQRAEAVRQYLISKGVDSEQLSARGYGKAQPVAGNETEDGRAQNRRVEFRIVLR